MKSASTLAVVLAGGKGKRMDILCHIRPKPVLPFAGRFKVIDFSLSNCVYSQINDIAVLTDYQRSQMATYLQKWHQANARSANFRVLEPKVDCYRGTADAAYQNLEYVNKRRGDMVLVLAGDHVYKLDYRKMVDFHQEVKADVTVGIIPVAIDQAHRFGTVTIDDEGRITEFLEKSLKPQSNLASMGIYVFNKDFLNQRLIEDAGDPNSQHDFGYSILPKIVKKDRVYAYRFSGYWQDIGTIEAYYEANMELTGGQPRFSLDGTAPVLTHEQPLSAPCLGKHATIRNSVVSNGCVVRGHVENSILSPGVWVDEQAVVKNSIVMKGTFIGYHSIVDRCVLDESVNVGDYCYVGFVMIPGDWDITVLGKGVTVPSHTAIGRGCKISPNIGPSDFATSVVSPGAVISGRRASNLHLERKVAVSEP